VGRAQRTQAIGCNSMLAVLRNEERGIHVLPGPLYLHDLDSVAFGLSYFVVECQLSLSDLVEIVIFTESFVVDAVYGPQLAAETTATARPLLNAKADRLVFIIEGGLTISTDGLGQEYLLLSGVLNFLFLPLSLELHFAFL